MSLYVLHVRTDQQPTVVFYLVFFCFERCDYSSSRDTAEPLYIILFFECYRLSIEGIFIMKYKIEVTKQIVTG